VEGSRYLCFVRQSKNIQIVLYPFNSGRPMAKSTDFVTQQGQAGRLIRDRTRVAYGEQNWNRTRAACGERSEDRTRAARSE